MKLTEATIFEYMEYEVKRIGAQGLSIAVSPIPGNYVAVFDKAGNCKCGKTIEEAASQLPKPEQQALNMIKEAEELEAKAIRNRAEAAKLLGQ